jgi:hypothetical protein
MSDFSVRREIRGAGATQGSLGLDEIPEVAVKVFEYSYGTVRLFLRSADEYDTARLVLLVITPKVIGVEEEENTPTGLIADGDCCSGVDARASSKRDWLTAGGATTTQRLPCSGTGESSTRTKPSVPTKNLIASS